MPKSMGSERCVTVFMQKCQARSYTTFCGVYVFGLQNVAGGLHGAAGNAPDGYPSLYMYLIAGL